jgi:Tfp pilus assembly protein PilV
LNMVCSRGAGVGGAGARRSARRRSARGAFTLVEVLVALVLIVVTIAPFLRAFVKARESALLADDRMKAVHFARMNLETLLTNTYSSSSLSVTNRLNWVTNCSVSGGVPSYYYCSYSVVTGQYRNSRIIHLTNSWYNVVSKRTNSVSLSTAICSGFQY